MVIVGFSLFALLVAAYAVGLRRGEKRRQEWRQESRAAWMKS